MDSSTKSKFRLSGNQLKLIALVTMTLDHIGVILLPQVRILRIIGRLSMPLFAWMIAEGCRHTRSPIKYLGRIALLGILCQVVMYIATGSLEQGILITFSLSICLILLLAWLKRNTGLWWLLLPALSGLFALTALLPQVLTYRHFCFDYGFCGMLLPVLIYLGTNKRQRLLLAAAGLVLLSIQQGGIQWYCLLSLPLLALYGGHRGKLKMKNLFYIYYPAHMAAVYLLGYLI